MAGPVALPERGVQYSYDTGAPPAGSGATAPIRIAQRGPTFGGVPLSLGSQTGGTTRRRSIIPPERHDPRSDSHPTDPWLWRFIAIPRRGQYGNDSHVLGPAAPGGARGLGGLTGTQRRRNDALPQLWQFIYGSVLNRHSPPSEFDQARPYFANVYATSHYQPPTQYSALELGVIAARPTDPGKIDNKRYDQGLERQEANSGRQRFLALPRDRIDRYQRSNVNKLGIRPQMRSPHDYQLANIPPASSVGALTETLGMPGGGEGTAF